MMAELTYERDADQAPGLAEIMARAAHAEFRRLPYDRWDKLTPQVRDRWIGEQRAAIAAAVAANLISVRSTR